MRFKKCNILIEIENLFIIILISFFFSDKIKVFLTSYYVCYMFILFHELSHIMFAMFFGKKIEKIKLSIAGVCVTFNNNGELEIVKNLIIYMAGPLANICLAIMFNNIDFVFEINVFLAILNLVPIYPLDGYNILSLFFSKKTIKNFEICFLSLLFLISIFIIIKSFNPSLFIFFVYVMLIKYVSKNHIK